MGITEYILAAAIFGGGFLFQSLFGFGGSFIIVLGLSLFMPVQSVIAILPLSLMTAAGLVVIRDPADNQWKKIFNIVAISSPGAIAGALLMNRLDSGLLIIFICGLILIYSIYSLVVKSIVFPEFMKIPYLILSGLIIGLTGLGIVYVPLVMQDIKKPAELRVSLHFLWVLLGLLRLPFYIGGGAISMEYLLIGLFAIPVILIAQHFGRKVHKRLKNESYHRGLLISLGIIVCVRLALEINTMFNGAV